MTAMPGCKIKGGTLGATVPMADVGELRSAIAAPHRYLSCACGAALYEGVNADGAAFYACPAHCRVLVDTRRVA